MNGWMVEWKKEDCILLHFQHFCIAEFVPCVGQMEANAKGIGRVIYWIIMHVFCPRHHHHTITIAVAVLFHAQSQPQRSAEAELEPTPEWDARNEWLKCVGFGVWGLCGSTSCSTSRCWFLIMCLCCQIIGYFQHNYAVQLRYKFVLSQLVDFFGSKGISKGQ